MQYSIIRLFNHSAWDQVEFADFQTLKLGYF